jgi:hypothetical protein
MIAWLGFAFAVGSSLSLPQQPTAPPRPSSAAPVAPVLAPNTTSFVVRGKTVLTMAGAPLTDGVVLVRDGKIAAVGAAAEVVVPAELPVLQAAIVLPGLIDAHATVGLSGMRNVPHDQDQLERSAPCQPELRAIDAYAAQDELVARLRHHHGAHRPRTGRAPLRPDHGREDPWPQRRTRRGAAAADGRLHARRRRSGPRRQGAGHPRQVGGDAA